MSNLLKTPLRCFDGNAQPYEPFWRMVDAAQSESGQAELELYGVLSEYSWLEDEITPRKFQADLYGIGKGGPVLLKINSPGGDVIAASVMRAILTDYPGEVTARVDGIAASAAVAVITAASKVTIMDTAYMMIHDPAIVVALAQLDIETLGKLRERLIDIKGGLVTAYAAKTGMSDTKISHLMSDETWLNASQAVELGFADAIIPGGQKRPEDVGFVNCLRNYSAVPGAVLQAFTNENVVTGQESSAPGLSVDIEREAQSLRERVSQILKKES